jgi:hypothetical protein
MDSYLSPVLQVFTLIGGGLALATFGRNVKIKRAEWLSSLHSKFFESDKYKRIRQILDYQTPERADLERALAAETPDNLVLVEEFVDYLNFFEFVASLWRLGQLELGEIEDLFKYYLDNLNGHTFATRYISAQSFENLVTLQSALAKRRGRILK